MRNVRSGALTRFLAVSALAVSPLATSASAQMSGPTDTTARPPKGSTAIAFGVQGMEVGALNAALRANGFPAMRSTSVVAGVATTIRIARWDLSFSGGQILGGREQSSAWRTELSGQSILVGAGYVLLDAGRWRVIPNAGVGLTRIGFHVEERRGGTVDSTLIDPLRGTDLSGQTWIWHSGVGVEYRLGRRPGQKVWLGLRVGYAKLLGSTDWRADGNQLSAGPRAGVQGPYVRLGVSFGRPRRRDGIITAVASLLPWVRR